MPEFSQSPRISVVLTTRNGAMTVERAVASVRAQSFADWELIVLDDASTDATPGLVAAVQRIDPRVRLVRTGEPLGRQRALNAACGVATGEFIAIIDDDDEWTEVGKLSAQVDFLNGHLDVGVVGTWATVVMPGGGGVCTLRPATDDRSIRTRELVTNQFIHSSVLFRRSLYVELGGYGEDDLRRYCEDYDFWLRLGKRAKFANIPAVMVAWQKSPNGHTATKQRDQMASHLKLIGLYGGGYPLLTRVTAYCATTIRYVLGGHTA